MCNKQTCHIYGQTLYANTATRLLHVTVCDSSAYDRCATLHKYQMMFCVAYKALKCGRSTHC